MEPVGKVSVEICRESVKIHADYRDSALGERWSNQAHPEFMVADLDDLIAALQQAKENLQGGR